MSTTQSVFHNPGRYVIEGTFDLSSSAAVSSISYPVGQTKTVRGQGMTCAKISTGTYDVTVKTSSTVSGATIQNIELLDAKASPIATTLTVVLSARVSTVTLSTAGDIVIRVITAQTSGAAADTTAAITVGFNVVFAYTRNDQVI